MMSLFVFTAEGQTIPVDMSIFNDFYRNQQLLGKVDSTISFTSKPFFPVEALKSSNTFDPTETFEQEKKTDFSGLFRFGKKNGVIQLLPFTWLYQVNTHHPYSLNDGPMIPARGHQSLLSGGMYFRYKWLSIQFRPEIVYAENNPFETFSAHKSDQVLKAVYQFNNLIDLPEKFGDKPYQRTYAGQSSVRLTVGALSAGISSENLWWGPGFRNSMMMSNSAPGFYHFTLNTVRPVRTPIGSFEGQLVGGRLDTSGFFAIDTNLVVNKSKLYHTKRNDWRYFSGVVLTYQPRWVPELFLGLTRTFITYYKDMGHRFIDFFPIITPLEKKYNYGTGESTTAGDQRISVFARWLLQKDHAEIYFEFGREDHAYDLRDLFLQPEYSRAYLWGFKKLFPLKGKVDQYLQLNFELTQIEDNTTNPRQGPIIFYTHGEIRQGYTHLGQMIGAGIGPGSSMQTGTFAWNHGLKSIGVQLERYVHNNNLFYFGVKDIRANWVDLNLAALGTWNFQNLLFTTKMEIIRSLNYQNNYSPIPNSLTDFWIPGWDVYNFQAQVGITYRF